MPSAKNRQHAEVLSREQAQSLLSLPAPVAESHLRFFVEYQRPDEAERGAGMRYVDGHGQDTRNPPLQVYHVGGCRFLIGGTWGCHHHQRGVIAPVQSLNLLCPYTAIHRY